MMSGNGNNNGNKKYEIIRELSVSVNSEGVALHILSSVKNEDFDFLAEKAKNLLNQYTSIKPKSKDFGNEIR